MANQGTVKKRLGVRVYALIVSVFAHAAALAIFAAVKLSQSAPVPLRSTATVDISQARQLSRTPAVVPKPKVVGDNRSSTKMQANPKSQITNFKQIPNPNYQTTVLNDVQNEQVELPTANEARTAQAEFFGSVAQGRRVCYVVDCSGSMQGLWKRVREELIESIGRLEADQYFCVIAFSDGSVQESGGGRMVRASERVKKEAYSFVDSLRPGGTTNAQDAIQKAVKIRDDTGVGPAVMYFLTDGFELSEQDSFYFAHQVMTAIRSFSPKTQINTIGFWPSEQDQHTLERIAKESGGKFVIITDEDVSTSMKVGGNE